MGRNHITDGSIECVIGKTLIRHWSIVVKSMEKMMEYNKNIIPPSEDMLPYDSFLLDIWDGLVSSLENPYPLGNHLAIVPEFGFTKRNQPVKFSCVRYVERIELKNSIYSMWCTETKGFVVTVGTSLCSEYEETVKTNGIPIMAFGDAYDFADYLMEFDSYIPRIEREHQKLVTRMKSFLKASELLVVTVNARILERCPKLKIKKLYLKDDNTVRYEFENQNDSFEGECEIRELDDDITDKILNPAHKYKNPCPFFG